MRWSFDACDRPAIPTATSPVKYHEHGRSCSWDGKARLLSGLGKSFTWHHALPGSTGDAALPHLFRGI